MFEFKNFNMEIQLYEIEGYSRWNSFQSGSGFKILAKKTSRGIAMILQNETVYVRNFC